MSYKKYTLALLCSVSLTGCWPFAAQENEEQAVSKTSYAVRHIGSESEFTRTIKQGNVVVDFYADWCGPCKRLSPVISDLADEFPNIKFIKVNIDNARSISSQYSVKSIPTLILFKDGKQVKRISGYKSKNELRSILQSTF